MAIDTIFKALADPTRLRIARLLSAMELAVGELAQVLGQSQPRVSRHVGILCDAGLAERRREGSWVFLRAAMSGEEEGTVLSAINMLLGLAEAENADFAAQCADDRRKLAAIRAAREVNAGEYFARHASEWDELRALHTPEAEVEAQLAEALGKKPLGHLLDIGTGTGRMAELFADTAERITALDSNLEMLKVARAKLQHLSQPPIDIVQGDFTDLPFAEGVFDTVLFHQVLHFAQDPALPLAEAARVISGGGRIAIVDFAAHDREELRSRHQHVRLGFSDKQMRDLLSAAGFTASKPITLEGGELVVKIWIAKLKSSASARAAQTNLSPQETTS